MCSVGLVQARARKGLTVARDRVSGGGKKLPPSLEL
jgi:hypothetical protein